MVPLLFELTAVLHVRKAGQIIGIFIPLLADKHLKYLYLRDALQNIHEERQYIMTFVQKISAYTLGLLTDKDLPDIAFTGLEEGYDSESLRILAGYNSNKNGFEIFDYFKKALVEIGVFQKNERESLINLIEFYAHEIITRQLDPYLGFAEINKIIRQTKFDYSDIFLDDCYADYITIWEVKSDGLQLHTGSGLTREQFINKTKEDLITDLIFWLNRQGI